MKLFKREVVTGWDYEELEMVLGFYRIKTLVEIKYDFDRVWPVYSAFRPMLRGIKFYHVRY
jgi:hypothetical protein